MLSAKVNYFLDIFAQDLARIHKGDTFSAFWPFISNEAEYYIGEKFLKDLLIILKILETKNISNFEIAKIMKKPSKWIQYLTYFHSTRSLSKEDRIWLFEKILSIFEEYSIKTEKFKNRLKSEFISFKFEELNFISKPSLLLQERMLISLLVMHLETIYPTIMRLGYEIHGEYNFDRNRYIVRDFFDLKLENLNLVIIEEIDGNFKVDILNHLIMVPQVKKFAILNNGKLLTEEEFFRLFEKIKVQLEIKNSMDLKKTKKEWLKEFSKNLYSTISPLLKLAELDKEVPIEILNKIDNDNFEFPIEKAIEFARNNTQEQITEKIKNSFLKVLET